jgi:hypothetical protein
MNKIASMYMVTNWMNSLTLQAFLKSHGTPYCIVVLVKGIAINGERRLTGHTGISHNSMFNCGF